MPPTWTSVVDNLFTTTWANRKSTAVEQAFLKTPLAYWLREKGRVENQSGYTRIEIPLDYGTNDSVRWIGKGDPVPITDPELLTMAYEEWTYVAVSIMRFGTDDQKNRGKAALIRLVDTKINAAERALREEFERAFWADGSGAKEPNGFQNIISTTPTVGTLHGIDRSLAANAYFRNQAKAATGAASLYLLSDMRTFLNTCTSYAETAENDIVICCDQTSYELYEDETMGMKSIVNKTLGDAGFLSVEYKGRPLIWSPWAVANQMRFVNTNYIKLVTDPDYYMDMTEWKPIPDQVNDRVCQILCTQNLVSSRPCTHGVLSITPS